MHYTGCFGYASGKLSSLHQWKDTAIVLKSGFHIKENREKLYNLINSKRSALRSLTAFMIRIRSKIRQVLGASSSAHLVAETNSGLFTQLWPGDEAFGTKTVLKPSMALSLRGLVEQREYLYLRLLGHQPYIPSVLATCGHIYATEYAPVTSSLDPDWHTVALSHHRPWEERRNVALQLLHIIDSLDKDFQEPIHFCDMKGINFGMTFSGQLKVIDIDTTYFQSLRAIHASRRKCSSHHHCDYIYCMGRCNFHRNKCEKKLANNNLQAACRVIFLPHWQNRYAGLLAQPPPHLAPELSSVLNDCLNLTHERLSNTSSVFQRLTTVLDGSERQV